MIKSNRLILLFLFLMTSFSWGQVKVISLPQYQNNNFDPIFFDSNEFRSVEILSEGWKVFHENDPESKISISVPAIYENETSLMFEKVIKLIPDQIQNSQIILGFLGLNYSAEIFLNGYSIYKHTGGAFPFEVLLPKDILKEESLVTIKSGNRLDSDNTIPSVQRFLFPSVSGGIIRDVYLKSVSNIFCSSNSVSYSFDQTFSKAGLNLKLGILNSGYKNNSQAVNILVRINLYEPNSSLPKFKGDFPQIFTQENNFINCKLDLTSLQLWSPQSPNFYLCEVILIKDGKQIDKTVRQIAFHKIKKEQNSFTLNGNEIKLQGTTYFSNETSFRKINVYQRIKEQLTFIKQTGFNAVRFSKAYPNPYALKICQQLGLFALVELPVNSVPEEILEQNDFQLNALQSTKTIISNYSKYTNTFIFGTGSSFLSNSQITNNFISNVGQAVKQNEILSYASFIGVQTDPIKNLDLFGIEIYSSPLDKVKEQLKNATEKLGKASIFISELSYPNYKGNVGGYLIKYSLDAQAKYYADIIESTRRINIPGFFINTFLSFNAEYASLFGGYDKNNTYKFYVLDPSLNKANISYKVLASKLGDNSKVTIPIGTTRDESPITFIIFALLLSVIMAVLINTKKKFREDCTRALLRPYNFFADVRDHRILSGIHTGILMLIQAGSISLLFTILLYFWRSNILFEKILLSFGHHSILKYVSYLAWNPQMCFVILFAIVLLKFVVLSLIIKFAAFFIKTRVEFSAVFYSVIWAFLPFTLLLLIELILYKLLMYGSFNTIILLFLLLFMLWILQRIIKSIYVIFDVRAFYVYLYSIAIIIIIGGGILLKYQITNSTIFYISNSIKQYQLMIL